MKAHRLVTAVALTAAVLAGCGDKDKDPSSEPTERETSSSPSPTESGPEPTDGEEVDDALYSFNLPDDWELHQVTDTGRSRALFGRAPENDNPTKVTVEVYSTVNFDDVTKLSPDVLEKWETDANGTGEVLPPDDWAGQRAYHLRGKDCSVGYCEQFGFNYKGHWVVVTLDFVVPSSKYAGKLPEFEHTPEQIQEIIAAVEASWEWK